MQFCHEEAHWLEDYSIFMAALTDDTKFIVRYYESGNDIHLVDERLQTLLRSIPVGIMFIDAETHEIVFANSKAIPTFPSELITL